MVLYEFIRRNYLPLVFNIFSCFKRSEMQRDIPPGVSPDKIIDKLLVVMAFNVFGFLYKKTQNV